MTFSLSLLMVKISLINQGIKTTESHGKKRRQNMRNKKDFHMGSSLIRHDEPRSVLMFIKLQTLRPVLQR